MNQDPVDVPIEQEIGGMKLLQVAVMENKFVSRLLQDWKSVRARTTAVVRYLLTDSCGGGKRKLFVDLGCNLGWFSLVALTHGCDVLCVEPNPSLIPVIARSAFLNQFGGSIIVVEAAAGDLVAIQELTTFPGHFGMSTVEGGKRAISPGRNHVHTPAFYAAYKHTRTAPVLTVGVGALLRSRVHVIKIDVEGSEVHAVRGMDNWLAHYGLDHVLLESKHRKSKLEAIPALLQHCNTGGGETLNTTRGEKNRVFQYVEVYDSYENFSSSRLWLQEIAEGSVKGASEQDFWLHC